MKAVQSSPSPLFTPIPINDIYNKNISRLTAGDCAEQVLECRDHFSIACHGL